MSIRPDIQPLATIGTVKTPIYAVIGAGDHAAKVALNLVTDLRTLSAARLAVRRYEKRGQMVVADLRRAPAITRVLQTAESAVDRVEDALEDLIKDAQGELRGARKTAQSTASKAKKTVRQASTRRPATSTKSRATKASATKTAKSPAKPTTRKATVSKASTAKGRANPTAAKKKGQTA